MSSSVRVRLGLEQRLEDSAHLSFLEVGCVPAVRELQFAPLPGLEECDRCAISKTAAVPISTYVRLCTHRVIRSAQSRASSAKAQITHTLLPVYNTCTLHSVLIRAQAHRH